MPPTKKQTKQEVSEDQYGHRYRMVPMSKREFMREYKNLRHLMAGVPLISRCVKNCPALSHQKEGR